MKPICRLGESYHLKKSARKRERQKMRMLIHASGLSPDKIENLNKQFNKVLEAYR